VNQLVRDTLGTVIPVYIKNSSDWSQLRRALNSIRIQTQLPDAVLITDDSDSRNYSTLIELVREFSDLPISVVRNLTNRGISENSNNGLNLIKAKFVHVLHQDDWLGSENTYERAKHILSKNPEKFILLGSSGSGGVSTPKFEITALVGNNQFGGPSGVIFPSNLGVSFDPRLEMLCDVDFVYRLVLISGTPMILQGNQIRYGISDDQAQRHISRASISEEIKLILPKHGLSRYRIFFASFHNKTLRETYMVLDSLQNGTLNVFQRMILKFVKLIISITLKTKY
jgi:hypothetical protein